MPCLSNSLLCRTNHAKKFIIIIIFLLNGSPAQLLRPFRRQIEANGRCKWWKRIKSAEITEITRSAGVFQFVVILYIFFIFGFFFTKLNALFADFSAISSTQEAKCDQQTPAYKTSFLVLVVSCSCLWYEKRVRNLFIRISVSCILLIYSRWCRGRYFFCPGW